MSRRWLTFTIEWGEDAPVTEDVADEEAVEDPVEEDRGATFDMPGAHIEHAGASALTPEMHIGFRPNWIDE